MENGRTHFPFPYQPYDIQEQFMQALYGALDQGKVGIFESPTGTVCLWTRMQKRYGILLNLLLFYMYCMSYTSGQVSESDMWSFELAHRLRGEEEAGGSCPAAGRRSSSFYFHHPVLHKQLISRARLDH